MSIGETMTRLFSVRPGPDAARRVTGWNIGGVLRRGRRYVVGEPRLAAGHELRVADPQVVVGDPPATGS